MPTIERIITVEAPVEKVFEYIDDPMNYPEWLPSLMEVKEAAGRGVGSNFRWTYKMAGLRLEGKTTVIENIPDRRIVTQTVGGIVSTWTWTFESLGAETRINLLVEYKIPIPVLGRIAEVLVLNQNEREADLAMANIKARLES